MVIKTRPVRPPINEGPEKTLRGVFKEARDVAEQRTGIRKCPHCGRSLRPMTSTERSRLHRQRMKERGE